MTLFSSVMSCFVTQLTHSALCPLSLHLTVARETHSSRKSLGSLGLALPRACLPTHTRASRPASTKPASTSLTTWSASAVVGETVCCQIRAIVSRWIPR